MKTCQNCGVENLEELNFCGECGTKFPDEPQMVVPFDTVESLEESPTERVTDSFEMEPEPETVVGKRFGVEPSIPTLSTSQPPSSSKKVFWIFGGCLTLLLLAFIGLGGVLFVNWQSSQQREVASNTEKEEPIPFEEEEEETPTPKPKRTPKPTPDEEPELEDPENGPKVTFTPPKKPTRSGSFSVKANQGWQVSEINTVGSEVFQTLVRGKIFLGGIDENISAKGISGEKDRRIYKQFRTGALLMRTRFASGKVGNIQPVTAYPQWENYKNESGRLEFLVNDNAPKNNKGVFIVTVKLVSVPK